MRRTRQVLLGLLLLICFLRPAVGQPRFFGSWFTGTTNDGLGLFAATPNDSGNILGQYCYAASGSCVYLLGIHTSCTKGHKYPVLMNSNTGSLQLFVLCDGRLDATHYRYIFTDFKAIDTAVRAASRIGFAVPLQGDQFIVVRFNLDGSDAAISSMRAAAENRVKPAVHHGTRDQRL